MTEKEAKRVGYTLADDKTEYDHDEAVCAFAFSMAMGYAYVLSKKNRESGLDVLDSLRKTAEIHHKAASYIGAKASPFLADADDLENMAAASKEIMKIVTDGYALFTRLARPMQKIFTTVGAEPFVPEPGDPMEFTAKFCELFASPMSVEVEPEREESEDFKA